MNNEVHYIENVSTIRTETLTDVDAMAVVELYMNKGYTASIKWDSDQLCYVITMTKNG